MAAWDELTEAQQNEYISMFVVNGMNEQTGIDMYNDGEI